MVSGGVHDRDAVVAEAGGLLEQEPLRAEGEPAPVEEVPRDQEGVDVLADREVHGPSEGLPGGVPETAPDGLGAAREGGVQVDVGDVHETHAPR